MVLARTDWEPHEPLATDNHRKMLRNAVSVKGSSSEDEEEYSPQEHATGSVDSHNDEEMRSEQEFHSTSDGTRQSEEHQELILALREQ